MCFDVELMGQSRRGVDGENDKGQNDLLRVKTGTLHWSN